MTIITSLNRRRLLYLVGYLTLATGAGFISLNENKIWARLTWIVIIILAIRIVPKVEVPLKIKVYLLIFSAVIFASMVVNDFPIHVTYIQRVLMIWLAASIPFYIKYENFMDSYVKFIRFIAFFSLICFALTPLIRLLPFPMFSAGEGFYYKCLIFTNVSMLNNRNYGPFWEPGAFQLFLNWALLYEVRNPHKLYRKDVILFSLTVLSTISTAGIIIIALILAYYYFNESKNKNIIREFGKRSFVIIVAVVGFVYLVSSSGINYFDKIEFMQENPEIKTSGNASTYTRYYSIFANLEAINRSPVFGVGVNGLKEEINDSYDLTSNTNSILSMPASFGVIAGFLYLYLIINGSFKKGRSIMQSAIFLIILLCIMSTENLIASLIFWIFLFYESNLKLYG